MTINEDDRTERPGNDKEPEPLTEHGIEKGSKKPKPPSGKEGEETEETEESDDGPGNEEMRGRP